MQDTSPEFVETAEVLDRFDVQHADAGNPQFVNNGTVNILNAVDNIDASSALSVYENFSFKNMQVALKKAEKFVEKTRQACISMNIEAPFVESVVDIEKQNINMLCRQVYYAMHAIDSVFKRIDAMGGGQDMEEFHALIHLQNDASRLLQSYIQYVRQLPFVFATYNRTAENAEILAAESSMQDGQKQLGGKAEAETSDEAFNIVTRSITELISMADAHKDKLQTSIDFEDDSAMQPMFEMSPEAAEEYGKEEVYKDEPTYAEILAARGETFDIEQEQKLQAKPNKQI